jgi:hypothetical protein
MRSLPLELSLPMQPGQLTGSMNIEDLPLEAAIRLFACRYRTT